MSFVKESFGTTKDGIEANIYTISNNNGMTARFTDYGAILMGLIVPDKDGNPTVVKVRGRHDACVLPRAVPIVESMAAIVLADAYLLNRTSRL